MNEDEETSISVDQESIEDKVQKLQAAQRYLLGQSLGLSIVVEHLCGLAIGKGGVSAEEVIGLLSALSNSFQLAAKGVDSASAIALVDSMAAGLAKSFNAPRRDS